ncbi:MAG: ABC transporter permease [Thermoplasmata archaeon]|nr:ABC transporter permease [Thermoplasmata archaeon]
MAAGEIGQSIMINVSVDSSLTSIGITADVVQFDILSGNRTDFALNQVFTQHGTIFSSPDLNPTQPGLYEVEVTAHDPVTPDTTVVNYTFAMNLPNSQLAPFNLIEKEGKLFSYQDAFTGGGRVSIAIESDAAKIDDLAVNCTVVLPDGNINAGNMIHPRVTAERNMFEQFWVYFTSMLQLDFGKSFYSQRPVWTEIQEKAPPTILLFGTALILQAVFGVLIGVLLAWRRGTRMELSAVVIALFFYSMPLFWFGIILIWIFAFQLGWFPFGGMVTPELSSQGYPDIWAQIVDVGSHMVLPLLTLMMVGLAFTILLMRNSMLDVLGEDYITTAKAKGLSERTVMYKHAARNAMLPVVTVIAISVGGVVSGGVLTETIFSWPGMGYYLVQSTLQQDYPAVQGVFFLLAVLTILANVVADVLYAFMDPRVRL